MIKETIICDLCKKAADKAQKKWGWGTLYYTYGKRWADTGIKHICPDCMDKVGDLRIGG